MVLDHLQLDEKGDAADTPVWTEVLDSSQSNVIKTKEELKAASLNKLIELLAPEGVSTFYFILFFNHFYIYKHIHVCTHRASSNLYAGILDHVPLVHHTKDSAAQARRSAYSIYIAIAFS